MVEAVSAFCEQLENCQKLKREPVLEPQLAEAMSLQLALAMHGLDKTGSLSPPSVHFEVSHSPDTFSTLEFFGADQKVAFNSEGQVFCLDLETSKLAQLESNHCLFRDRSKSTDGRFFTDKHDFVGLYDSRTDELIRRFSWSRDSAGACTVNVAFSNDEELLAVSYAYDSTVRLWNVSSGALVNELQAADHEAAIQFSPDSKFLFAGTKNGARLFHLASGLAIYSNTIKQSYAVGYSPDGKCVVSDFGGPAICQVDLSALHSADQNTANEIVQSVQQRRQAILNSASAGSDWERLVYVCASF